MSSIRITSFQGIFNLDLFETRYFTWMLAESSDFQSEMKASYLIIYFPYMEAPTFSRGASHVNIQIKRRFLP